MAIYFYQATDRSGKLIEGSMEGGNKSAVIQHLQSAQLLPVKVEEKSSNEGFLQRGGNLTFAGRAKGKDILAFTRNLSTLLNAGLTLDRSLATLVDLNERESLRKAVAEIQKHVHGGTSFTEALGKNPGMFSPLYISMVKAGEEGGVLELILDRLADFLENSERIKENIRSALFYPTILTLFGGLAVIVLVTFVLPRFSRIFADMGEAIPTSTKLLLSLSSLLTGYWWAILLAGLFGFFALRAYRATEGGRLLCDTLLLKMPLVGDLQLKVQVSRFTRTLGTLMRSGVPLLKALSITGETLTNSAVSRSVKPIVQKIKEGGHLSNHLRESGTFPPLALHMLMVGEETGKMEEMLLKVSNTYDEEIDRSVKRLMSLLEPIMILVMGLVVGFIVVSMLMAVFSMNEMPI